MRPDDDVRRNAEFMVNVLSSLLERRTIDRAADEAELEYWDAVLQQKRGSRR